MRGSSYFLARVLGLLIGSGDINIFPHTVVSKPSKA